MFPQFSGTTKIRQINLGGSTSSSSPSPSASPNASGSSSINTASSVIAKARAERLHRERLRAESDAAVVNQRVWRGRVEAGRAKEALVRDVRDGTIGALEAGMALRLVLWKGEGEGAFDKPEQDREEVLLRWCESRLADTPPTIPQLFLPPSSPSLPSPSGSTRSSGGHVSTLSRLCYILLRIVGRDASTTASTTYLTLLERALDRSAYVARGQGEFHARLVRWLLIRGFVRLLVGGFRAMPAAGRKKHPSTPTLLRLTTMLIPDTIHTASSSSDARIVLVQDLVRYLLTIPSLPSIMPLQSLTQMCSHLRLFELVFPLMLRDPRAVLDGLDARHPGGVGELGMASKTCLLANFCTIVFRGGLLGKQDATGARVWMSVLREIFQRLDGWASWIEAGSMSEDVDMSSSGRVPPDPVPSKAIITSAMLLIGSDHIRTLRKHAIGHPSENMEAFISTTLAMLQSARGTAAWESIVDNLLDGEEGVALLLTLWRDYVRGKWTPVDVKRRWETLYIPGDRATEVYLPALVLLSILYTQHLSTLPDTEFFSTDMTVRRQTLSLDDVLDLARIWRDLAFVGFWTGLAPRLARGGADNAQMRQIERQKEHLRGIFTRALTAVCARDARRRFAPEGYWIIHGEFDIASFIEAVCVEETQLEQEQMEADEMAEMEAAAAETNAVPPAWVRARKAISKRQMALISPRLGLLNNLPMTLPFESRVAIFDQFIYNDRHRLGIERYTRRQGMVQRARIRRSNLSEDGFRELDKLGPLLKSTIQIEFIDQWGQVETGIDGGGLFKEFLTSLAKEVFDPSRGLWLTTTQNELWPNPHGYAKEPFQLAWYQFLGRVLGKALYEGILVDVRFAGFFLAKWLGRQSHLDDLASLDPELYKGLIALKNYSGDPEDLSLNFVVSEEDLGVTRSVELVRNGANVAVTKSNRTEYIQAMCAYKLNTQIAQQTESFFSGLSDIVDTKWLRMFDQQELQMLIGGVDTPIDVDDLRQNAVTSDGDDHPSITLFWKVVKSMTQLELKALLRFVTSVGRPPLLGFASLNPRFGVRLAGDDQTRLPSASACANLLKLPRYRDEYTLRSKLLQAINSNAGFDLS